MDQKIKGCFAMPLEKSFANQIKVIHSNAIHLPKLFTLTPKVIRVLRCGNAYFQFCVYVYTVKSRCFETLKVVETRLPPL